MDKSLGKKPNAAIFKKLALFYQGIQTLQKITNNGFTFPKRLSGIVGSILVKNSTYLL